MDILTFGISEQACFGETESGDACVIEQSRSRALIGVIDGLGHGSEAAFAAKKAAEILHEHASEMPSSLVDRCHVALRGSRGAVIGLASFDAVEQSMTWVGVGNVEGVLFRAAAGAGPARLSLVTRGGVIGYQLPPLRVSTIPIVAGDTLVVATDGIAYDFTQVSPLGRDPEDVAEEILARFKRTSDDALVLVARYDGMST